VRAAEPPECLDTRHQRGRHIVDRDEQTVQRRTTVLYSAKILSKTDCQE
jgi:hypothetical protein